MEFEAGMLLISGLRTPPNLKNNKLIGVLTSVFLLESLSSKVLLFAVKS